MALGENLCSMVDKVIGLREKYRTQRPEYRMFTHMNTVRGKSETWAGRDTVNPLAGGQKKLRIC